MNMPLVSAMSVCCVVIVALAGCGSETLSVESVQRTQSPIVTYPSPDNFLGEVLQKNESDNARKIALAIEYGIRRKHKSGKLAMRDAHPKSHGCVEAKFVVEPKLDEQLAKGVFVPGKAYNAIVRFSNGDEDPNRPDNEGDGRGMAVKLLDVPGEKLLDFESDAKTQDFIMISHPVFLISDIQDYLSLVKVINSDSMSTRLFRWLTVPWALGWKGVSIARETTSKRIDNPLKARYWSMVPYQLGLDQERKAVKYSARQCEFRQYTPNYPRDPGKDFLRDAMIETLGRDEGACMEFLVQVRNTNMSVEDVQTEWDEAEAPFQKVAEIRFPKQVFDTPEANRQCENLSFNPWHALEEHRPLGAVNRVRKAIYPHISLTRHELNGEQMKEPR